VIVSKEGSKRWGHTWCGSPSNEWQAWRTSRQRPTDSDLPPRVQSLSRRRTALQCSSMAKTSESRSPQSRATWQRSIIELSLPAASGASDEGARQSTGNSLRSPTGPRSARGCPSRSRPPTGSTRSRLPRGTRLGALCRQFFDRLSSRFMSVLPKLGAFGDRVGRRRTPPRRRASGVRKSRPGSTSALLERLHTPSKVTARRAAGV
jgi:hypothetical protein